MPGGLHGHRQIMPLGVSDGLDHVGRVGRADDRLRPVLEAFVVRARFPAVPVRFGRMPVRP
jgi:hypothetical protein